MATTCCRTPCSRTRSPGLQVIQHAETARAGEREYAEWNTKKVPEMRDYLVRLDRALETGMTSKGVALDAATRESFGIDAGLLRHWLVDAGETRWERPDTTVDGDTTLDLGGRVVELRFFGPANTDGDLSVWDLRTRTLVTGDVVVAPTPYAFGSRLSGWVAVLEAMRALAPARIVPGHGDVMEDDAYLARLAALLQATRSQVGKAVADGFTLEQVQQAITLPEYQAQFAGDDPARLRAFRAFYLGPAIPQAYKEATGVPAME